MSRYVPPNQRSSSSSTPSSSSSSSSSVTRTKVAPSPDDFPTLGSSTTRKNAWGSTTQRFSDLAQSWAQQEKEEDTQKKRLAREKMTIAQQQREKEEKEKAFYRVTPTRLMGRSSTGEECFDLGGDTIVLSDEEEVFEEEEEEELDSCELDAGWNQRRNKNDLY